MADVPTLSITLLGAGQEVGRSCCVLQYRDITIVLDAGVHPAHTGMASLPFVDELDWSTVDAILITQCASFHFLNREQCLQYSFSFHLDHAAALTYITEKVREGLHSTISAQLLVCLDKFQRGKRQNLHDPSNESASQVYDAGLRSDEVCC
jgi:predicted metal-dependent RNase